MVLHFFKLEDIGRELAETSFVSMIFTVIIFLMHIAVNNLLFFPPQICMALNKVEKARNQFLLLT